MAILIKRGVRVRGLQPEMLLALFIAEHEYACAGHPMWITSVTDGKHSPKSLHYTGLAVDIRSKILGDPVVKQNVASAIRAALGECYEVFLEDLGGVNEHIHIEMSPVGLEKRQ